MSAKNSIPSNAGPEISLENLRRAYIVEGLTPELISERFKLNVAVVEELVKEHGWAKQRAKIIRTQEEDIGGDSGDPFKDYHHLYREHLKAHNQLLRAELVRYRVHLAYYGDPYLRDPKTGNILYDIYGKPILFKLSNGLKRVEAKSLQDAAALARKGAGKAKAKSEQEQDDEIAALPPEDEDESRPPREFE